MPSLDQSVSLVQALQSDIDEAIASGMTTYDDIRIHSCSVCGQVLHEDTSDEHPFIQCSSCPRSFELRCLGNHGMRLGASYINLTKAVLTLKGKVATAWECPVCKEPNIVTSEPMSAAAAVTSPQLGTDFDFTQPAALGSSASDSARHFSVRRDESKTSDQSKDVDERDSHSSESNCAHVDDQSSDSHVWTEGLSDYLQSSNDTPCDNHTFDNETVLLQQQYWFHSPPRRVTRSKRNQPESPIGVVSASLPIKSRKRK